MEVKFYDEIEDNKLKYAVIASRYKGQWVYCKHKERDTFEVPGGHREQGETIVECAKRELYEETGAVAFELIQIGVYSVVRGDIETFGMLFFAEISELGKLPDMEIEQISFFDEIPEKLTYPLIQPKLVEKISKTLIK
ncbi:NUDIX domain-containing protein [Niameybacter massiliensis]|uniref:NUDIX domain-containing protein n=1 Tax=Holtiella tumoricola TaxID=3018743 RepID=A0AA42DLS9_9FIRM|nr:NUDIX domain-containing protein [Holtiella tumoricola]MDA3731141.1 NUDIX domain-containing protein [Holtiella tumoricola]